MEQSEGRALINLMDLQQALSVFFNNPSLLKQALVHSSFINENPDLALTSNERLEFLGDSVLGLVVAEKLYQGFPDFTEGKMTKLRAALVRRDTLARIARTIRLGDYFYLGKGEEASGGRDKPVNLAGTLEALIAAVYLDRGLDTARDFVLGLLGEEMQNVISQHEGTDYKSRLQEIIQAREQRAPEYYVIEASGPEHERRFTVEVRAGETLLGRGSGGSKKMAETEAARAALSQLSTSFTQ